MEQKNEIDMALAIKLEGVIEVIRSEMLDIYYSVDNGKTKTADTKLKKIENLIIDFACGDAFDFLGGDLQKARENVGEKRKESRLKNKQNKINH